LKQLEIQIETRLFVKNPRSERNSICIFNDTNTED